MKYDNGMKISENQTGHLLRWIKKVAFKSTKRLKSQ